MLRALVVAAVLGAASVNADLYMHNMRGSNGRLNEANTNRNNGNRLFDTQNNAKGGYCVGPAMDYYEGSLLTIEWTNQHGCGQNPKLYCNMVIQYMCGSSTETDGTVAVRDGTSTDTISTTVGGQNDPLAVDANGAFTYGMHEPLSYYADCATRLRNAGLWASDQNNLGQNAVARQTRQNNNGNRRGLECAEERDYYPYWHPTPWRDVAILTQDTTWCPFYQAQSQNVMEKGHCVTPAGTGAPENNEAACQDPNTWETVAAWGIPAPECLLAPWSRHNHLGNGLNGFTNSYNWTMPTRNEESCITDGDNGDCNCVLRLRYNISTSDLDKGTTQDKSLGEYHSGNSPEVVLDWTKDGPNSPVTEDPTVTFDENIMLKLAIDTSQFGRTFQDRSHVFHLLPRPDGVSAAARIYNLNVRGKRGNIVQTYPSVEYDFVPQNLDVRVGDFVHFQWTGCDTNPAGNAGEGTAQTDRSNIVQLGTEQQHQGLSSPVSDEWIAANPNDVMFPNADLRKRMAYLDQDPAQCESYESILARNNDNENQADADEQNCFKLNKASQKFDAGLVRMNASSKFYYMSSRNNNFSNRGQKGSLFVNTVIPVWAIILIVIGAVVAVASFGMAAVTMAGRSNPRGAAGQLLEKLGG